MDRTTAQFTAEIQGFYSDLLAGLTTQPVEVSIIGNRPLRAQIVATCSDDQAATLKARLADGPAFHKAAMKAFPTGRFIQRDPTIQDLAPNKMAVKIGFLTDQITDI